MEESRPCRANGREGHTFVVGSEHYPKLWDLSPFREVCNVWREQALNLERYSRPWLLIWCGIQIHAGEDSVLFFGADLISCEEKAQLGHAFVRSIVYEGPS